MASDRSAEQAAGETDLAYVAQHDAPEIQPDPQVWPECSECGAPWVLRRVFFIAGGGGWAWQRDCKHRKAEPRIAGRQVS